MNIFSLLLIVFSISCTLGQVTNAVAVLQSTNGNTAIGIVRFARGDDATVTVAAKVFNLGANTQHGFHVHQDGDITDPQGMNAGSHFNPLSQPHACPPTSERHVGDLGNLKSDANGTAIYTDVNKLLTLDPSSDSSIIGRGLIIHAAVDDCTTQPTGNSGGRIAQGVIGICGMNCITRFNIESPYEWDLDLLYL